MLIMRCLAMLSPVASRAAVQFLLDRSEEQSFAQRWLHVVAHFQIKINFIEKVHGLSLGDSSSSAALRAALHAARGAAVCCLAAAAYATCSQQRLIYTVNQIIRHAAQNFVPRSCQGKCTAARVATGLRITKQLCTCTDAASESQPSFATPV